MGDSDTNRISGFEKISVKGFRRLCNIELELRPLTVLIGANGTGKTSLLDVFSLLANSAQGALSKTISDFSGLPALITYDRAKDLSVELSMSVHGQAPLDYLLRLKPQGTAYVIAEENLSQQQITNKFVHIASQGPHVEYFDLSSGVKVRPTWEHNPLETSLYQVPKTYREPEDFSQKARFINLLSRLER